MSPVLLQLSLAEHLRPQRYFARSCRISAVTLARAFSNTFAGIRLQDVPGFVAAQFGGALAATALFRSLLPDLSGQASTRIFQHVRGNPASGCPRFCCSSVWRSTCGHSVISLAPAGS